jgi:hypothetical protein
VTIEFALPRSGALRSSGLPGFYLPFNRKLVEVDGIVLKGCSKKSVFSSYYGAISFWVPFVLGQSVLVVCGLKSCLTVDKRAQ